MPPRLVPVEHDPFADAPASAETTSLTPVEHDPFQEKRSYGLGEALQEGARNFGSSVLKQGENIVNAVTSPIDTATGLARLGMSLATREPTDFFRSLTPYLPEGKARDTIESALKWNSEPLEAVKKDLIEAYGGWENFKRTMAEDPARIAMDAASIIPGGQVAKIPGVAKVTGAVSRIPGVAKTAEVVSGLPGATASGLRKAGQEVIGKLTGTSRRGLEELSGAGYRETMNPAAVHPDIRGQMTGAAPATEVVSDLKSALSDLAAQRQQEYLKGMASTNANPTIMDFTGIEKALDKAKEVGGFKGKQLETNATALGVRDKIAKAIEDWKNLNPDAFPAVDPAILTPAEFHTPAGLDALKKHIGNIRDALSPTESGFRPAHKYANEVYSAIRKEITKADPAYAKTMGAYHDASEFISEAEKSLGLGNKKAADTALRKLQSVFRNNANTGYGNRVQTLDKLLRQTGYEDVAAKLAAQQMSSWMPRGIQGAVASSIPALGAYLTHPFLTGIAAPFSSPRLMGEAAYGIGKGRAMYEKNMSPWLSPAMKEMTLPRAAVTGRLEDEGALPPQQRARGGYLRTRGR